MSVLAIQAILTWPFPSKDPQVMHDRIHDMKEKLFWDWCYEENGPRLRGEILSSLFSDPIINDMKALHEMGCRGNVVFAQSGSAYPLVKCVLEPNCITWWSTQGINTPIRYDPIKRRRI